MLPTVIETVAKYFFFSALDERVSFAASLKVLAEIKSKNWLTEDHRARWVETLTKWKPKLAHVKPRAWSGSGHDRGFTLPGEVDVSLWAAFQTSVDPAEVEAVLLSQVLAFTDDEIADGLGVSRGTVRYRVGRGLRHLGGYVES
jgi:DNA-directed RNA polymerase specialized sigma24 family protein